jgi:hypothetical protein
MNAIEQSMSSIAALALVQFNFANPFGEKFIWYKFIWGHPSSAHSKDGCPELELGCPSKDGCPELGCLETQRWMS